MRLFCGIEKPDKGNILFCDVDTKNLSKGLRKILMRETIGTIVTENPGGYGNKDASRYITRFPRLVYTVSSRRGGQYGEIAVKFQQGKDLAFQAGTDKIPHSIVH
jgi:hypothetical protein